MTHSKDNITHTHEDSCCASKEKITLVSSHKHTHNHEHEGHDHEHGHSHEESEESLLKSRWTLWMSLLIVLTYLLLKWGFGMAFSQNTTFVLMAIAYLGAGYKTVWKALKLIGNANLFNEFTLMTLATLGAFYIGEYTEGVAVMLFYEIGELFQDLAVNRSKKSIKALLDVRPEKVALKKAGNFVDVNPQEVKVGDIIQVKSGEKVALDSILLSDSAVFNTAALTGESRPDSKKAGEEVFAGMISIDQVCELQVTTLFKDSKLSRILEMVQDATARKAPTQLFISRFAKIYTPIVFFLALGITVLPYFFVTNYVFNEWLYRGMVFLVISCPCALTISIPLGYFGGIGLASRNGILFKGSNFLDVVTKLTAVVMDKTGTLTKGVFKVQKIDSQIDEKLFIQYMASLESVSTHPVAKAVVSYADKESLLKPADVKEISGQGLSGKIDNHEVLAGNAKLMHAFRIEIPESINQIPETVVIGAIDGKYAGFIIIADEPKEDAANAVSEMRKLGLKTVMLSGDKSAVVQKVAESLKLETAYGDLLPEDKVNKVQELKDKGYQVAFVGDGLNDAPVIALADVGIAMGGLGSDATIETADVVIQNDQPHKIVSAIKIGKITRSVVWQNIILAMSVKLIVLIAGAGGLATLWEAVFADVGVALLAILNAYRIQGKEV
ncbi:Cd2+/Zn2+-exporting ATPase [Pseudarcicella hirudinis]|uniref:P-type Zn(2+) transporter n=1 Tax=Pseudarcicella hirudinis TaxID=1079859 RepID=A0A1I5SQ27_9BACT|nr:heavy metal translocating P-type ATPase [Pseudarcicella hirudinis]SFP72894.1 Cd2+/Zn2+-exporting ATPase [Pseudarcicella hirudinis]